MEQQKQENIYAARFINYLSEPRRTLIESMLRKTFDLDSIPCCDKCKTAHGTETMGSAFYCESCHDWINSR